jgi:hypothetical protein
LLPRHRSRRQRNRILLPGCGTHAPEYALAVDKLERIHDAPARIFLIAWPTQNPLPNARARPSAEHFAIAAS